MTECGTTTTFAARLRAGRDAQARLQWQEAAAHFDECLSIAARDQPVPILEEFEIQLARGICLRNAADWRPAWRALRRAFDLAVEHDDATAMGRAALELMEMNAPLRRLAVMADKALGSMGSEEPELRARLLAARVAWDQDPSSGHLVAEALALAQSEDGGALAPDDVLALISATLKSRSLYRAGDVLTVGERGRRAHAALHEAGRVVTAARILLDVGSLEMWGGHIARGERTLLGGAEYAAAHGLHFYHPRLLARVGNAAFARADWGHLDEVISELGLGADTVHHPLAVMRAEVRGDFANAIADLPKPEAAGRVPGFLGYIRGIRARVFLAAGRPDDARREMAGWYQAFDAQLGMRRGGDVGPSTLAEIDTVLAELGDERSCRELYDELEARPWARFGGRGYDIIRGALAERLDLPGRAEIHYRTGTRWARREGLPIEEGRCLLALARLGRSTEPDRAAAMAERAERLFRRYGVKLYHPAAVSLKRALRSGVA